jgi:hypothetical protein
MYTYIHISSYIHIYIYARICVRACASARACVPAPGVRVKASIEDFRRRAADFLPRLSAASDRQGLIVEPISREFAKGGGC